MIMPHKAVFFDRDGTLIDDAAYLNRPDGVRLLEGAAEALIRLREAGFRLVIATNQSGVARGLFTVETLERIHDELRRRLGEAGASIDAIYYCPHLPEGTIPQYARDCDQRKPAPGMLLQAAREMDLDLPESWMVGDSGRDIEAGRAAGCRTILLGSAQQGQDARPDYTCASLAEAVEVILDASGCGGETDPPATDSSSQAEATDSPPSAPPVDPHPAANTTGEEILSLLRQLVRSRQSEEFSFAKLVGGIVQVLALLTLLIVFIKLLGEAPILEAICWAAITVCLQTMALTFFMLHQRR
jgi:D-glycero-D-manno-heptose 1,7-bisphosphate phosphatase